MIKWPKKNGTAKIELGEAMSPGNVCDLAAKQAQSKILDNDIAAFLKSGGNIQQR